LQVDPCLNEHDPVSCLEHAIFVAPPVLPMGATYPPS
jgi:hypothetical protein